MRFAPTNVSSIQHLIPIKPYVCSYRATHGTCKAHIKRTHDTHTHTQYFNVKVPSKIQLALWWSFHYIYICIHKKTNMSKVYQGHWNFGVNILIEQLTLRHHSNLIPSDRKSRTSPMITGFFDPENGHLKRQGPHEISENRWSFQQKLQFQYITASLEKNNNTKTLNLSESWYLQQHMPHFYQTRASTHQSYQSPSHLRLFQTTRSQRLQQVLGSNSANGES